MTNAKKTFPHDTPSRGEVFLDNLPYAVMIALGAALIWLALRPSHWSWTGAAVYLAYSALGTFWFILFVCPYCGRGTSCPSGYGGIAQALRGDRDRSLFPQKFARHVLVIVPLWFAPLVVAAPVLVQGFDLVLASLAAIFALEGLVILPLVSRKWNCGTCERRDDCPWMKRAAERAGERGPTGSTTLSGRRGPVRSTTLSGRRGQERENIPEDSGQ